MTSPMMILGVLALLLGIFSSGIIDFVSKVAAGLM